MTIARLKQRTILREVKSEPIDITRLMRAEIQARDWSRVMIEGDRAEPVEIVSVRKWRFS